MLPQKHFNKRVVRAGWEGFALPKQKNIKVLGDPVKTPEKDIQHGVDELLQIYHIPYIRLPQMMFVAIIKSAFSNQMKGYLLDGLAGFPDNTALLPLCEYEGKKFCLACLIENKTEKGKLRGKQKIKDLELGFNLSRDVGAAQEIIITFKKFHKFVSDLIRTYRDATNPTLPIPF